MSDGPRETTVLKLGGSVITDKGTFETLDEDALRRTADAVAAYLDAGGAPIAGELDDAVRLALVHGAGGFGHYHANEHGVSTTAGTRDAAAVLAIHDSMRRLNNAVLERLHERGVPALPVHPLSAATRGEGGELCLTTRTVTRMLAEGFVPVLYGAVHIREGAGATIVSGDEIVVALAGDLDADRVGVCSTVPGVLNAEGRVVERIGSLDTASEYLGESDATDVTGGMYGKVEQLLSLDASASVFDLDRVEEFLAGGSPGTQVG